MNKKDLRLPAILMLGIYAVYGLVLTPLFQFLLTDIVLQGTLWLDLVDLLIHHAEIYASAVLFAFLVRSIYRYGIAASKPVFLLAGIALALKYLFAIIGFSVIFGSIDLTGSLTGYLFSFLLETTLAALTVLLSYRMILPQTEAYQARKNASLVLQRPFSENDPCLPLDGLFSRRNPLQRVLFWSVLSVLIWRLAAYIISDLAYGLDFVAGDIPVMLLYWLILIILPCFFGYLIALRLVRIPPYQEKSAADAQA